MKSTHGLRTTGIHTGNFGRPKVQAKRDTLDLTKEILTKDNLRIPNRDDAFTRLVEAYNKSTDPKLRKTLWEMLRQRRATLHSQPNTNSNEDTTADFWEMVRRVR
jgi:hypothetical protein